MNNNNWKNIEIEKKQRKRQKLKEDAEKILKQQQDGRVPCEPVGDEIYDEFEQRFNETI